MQTLGLDRHQVCTSFVDFCTRHSTHSFVFLPMQRAIELQEHVVISFLNGSTHIRKDLRQVLQGMIAKNNFDVDSVISQFDTVFDMSFSFISTNNVETYVDRLKRMSDSLKDRSTKEEKGSFFYMKLMHGSLLLHDVILHLV
jgi:hypothetical protein